MSKKLIVSEAAAPYGQILRRTSAGVRREGTLRRERKIAEPWMRKGRWTEEEYLALNTNNLIEFNNGMLEILPMPSDFHQAVSWMLTLLFTAFDPHRELGKARCAPLRLKVPGGKFREPDLMFLLREHEAWRGEKFWTGADLVMEIVSPDGENRDRVEKRIDYAAAGISEYWLIDREPETITVLRLNNGEYVEHGVFKRGEIATSVLLKGFCLDVSKILNAD